MRSIANELNTLRNNKKLLKQAIIDKGQKLADGDRFDTYPIRIDNISMGNKIFKTIDERDSWGKPGSLEDDDIVIVYNEDTKDLQGIYYKYLSSYKLIETQFTIKPEYVFEGTYYGPDGKAEGNMTEFKPSSLTEFSIFYDKLATSIKIDGNFSFSNYTREIPKKLAITEKCTSGYNMFLGKNIEELDLTGSNTSNMVSLYGTFRGCRNLKKLDLSGLDFSKVKNFEMTFASCSVLEDLKLPEMNMQNVTTIDSMFQYCTVLPEINVSNWDTSNITDMESAFSGCRAVTKLDVSNWNTENVTNMKGIFMGCKNITELDVSNWNTENVTNMSSLFQGCQNLTYLDLSNWDTENVTNISSMFASCYALENIDWGNFNTSNVTNMHGTFIGVKAPIDITKLSFENVTDLSYTFDGCNLIITDFSSINMPKVKKMARMFQGNTYIKNVNLSNTTCKVTDIEGMFVNCYNLQSVEFARFDTSEVTDISNMFLNCNSLTTLDISNFDLSNVTVANAMFELCSKLTNESLNSILAALPTASSLADVNKTLKYLELSETQATTCTTLSNWEACVNAGWTTGY